MSTPIRIWHPFTNALLDPAPLHVASAQGVYLHLADGRRILDGISSWWVNLHGHGHPAIVEAIAKQAAKVDHVLAAGFTHDALEELREGLQEALPSTLTLTTAGPYFSTIQVKPGNCAVAAGAAMTAGAAVAVACGADGAPART